MSRGATLVHSDGTLVLASYQDIFLQRWRGEGTLEQVQRMLEAHRRFVDARPDRSTLSLAHIQMERLRAPDPQVRALIEEHTRTLAPRILAGVTVIEATGFAGALVHGVISGLARFRTGRSRQQIRRSVREGLEYLLSQRDRSAPPLALDDVDAAYRALR